MISRDSWGSEHAVIYSVFNKSLGTYSIYEGGDIAVPKSLGRSLGMHSARSSLGAAPEEVSDVLPEDAKYIGESERAEGRIVEKAHSFGSFVFTVLTFIAARWIYDTFFKR